MSQTMCPDPNLCIVHTPCNNTYLDELVQEIFARLLSVSPRTTVFTLLH